MLCERNKYYYLWKTKVYFQNKNSTATAHFHTLHKLHQTEFIRSVSLLFKKQSCLPHVLLGVYTGQTVLLAMLQSDDGHIKYDSTVIFVMRHFLVVCQNMFYVEFRTLVQCITQHLCRLCPLLLFCSVETVTFAVILQCLVWQHLP